MLDKQDIQVISELLDQKLKTSEDSLTKKFDAQLEAKLEEKLEAKLEEKLEAKLDEKLGEVLSAVNDGFTEMQNQFEELKTELKGDIMELRNEISKRPTKDEIFSWADRRFTELEIAKERHDYLHIDELENLPPPAEINRILVERGIY